MKIVCAPCTSRPRRQTDRTGLTLVELLVVLSIIVTAMGLVSAAFTGMWKASSLTNAGNRLVSLLNLARQNAIARNAMTALVIPTGREGWNSCIVYELAPKADGSTSATMDWRTITSWERLPAGIVIDDCRCASQDVPKQFPALPPIKFFDGSTALSFCYIVFTPTGALYPFPASTANDSNPAVRLTEGIRTGSEVGDVSYIGSRKNEQSNFYGVTILRTTGLAKIDRP